MNWKTSDKKCLVISHRGNRNAAVENTLPAIESALRLGVDGVEVDLRLTRDGEIVVFHDSDLKRLIGSPQVIEKTSLKEIKTFHLKGEPIPTLMELLDLVKDRALLNLEIKTQSALLEKKLVAAIKSFRIQGSTLVSSFYPLPLWRLKQRDASLARGYLFEDKFFLHRFLLPLIQPLSVNAPLSQISPSWVHSIHASGRRLFVWTVNDEEDMKFCVESGVDGMITDYPQRLVSLLKDFK